MKKIINLLLATLVFLGVSCTEDLEYRPGGVTAVKELLAPADNYYVELQSSSKSTLNFQWEPAQAEDGQKPQYEVVFFQKIGGEILYRLDAGSSTSYDFKHKDLNIAAKAAGVAAGESGEVFWAVVANRGVTSAPVEATPRSLTIKRLFGFDVIPSTLFLSGAATEYGTDLSGAMQFQSTGTDVGEYTAVTRLKAGETYEMWETAAGGRHFTIENGELREFGADVKPASKAATADKDGLFRIWVDFNTRATLVEEITKVAFYQRDDVGHSAELTYQGRGLWRLTKHTTASGDDRYGFYAQINGETSYQEKWSSVNFNNNSAPTTGTAIDWWRVTMNKDTTSDGWWGYAYKWITSEWEATKVVTIEMHIDHTHDFFYHTVTYVK